MARYRLAVEDDQTDNANTSTDDGGSVGDDPVQQDDKIVIPDLKDLNVNEVAKAEHEIKKDLETQQQDMTEASIPEEQRTVALKDAQVDTQGLLTSLESLIKTMGNGRAADYHQARQADVYLKQVNKQNGLQTKYWYTVENFAAQARKARETEYMCEGFVDTLKEIWNACMRLVDKAIAWFKGFISKYFFTVKNDIEVSKDTMGEIKALDKINGEKIIPTDKKHWINSPELFMQLSIENTIPNLKTHFENVYQLSRTYSAIEKNFAPKFMEILEEHLEVLSKDGGSLAGFKSRFLPDAEAYTLTDQLLQLKQSGGNPTFNSEFNGEKALPGYGWMETIDMPGNFVIGYHTATVSQNPSLRNHLDTIMGLEFLRDWKIKCVRNTFAQTQDGWFPYGSAAELEEVTALQVKALRELETFEKNPDSVERVFQKLKAIAEKAKVQAAGVDPKKLDATGVESLKYVNTMVAAINTVISNLNYAIAEIGKYIRGVCLAWNYFLKLVKQEYIKAGAASRN